MWTLNGNRANHSSSGYVCRIWCMCVGGVCVYMCGVCVCMYVCVCVCVLCDVSGRLHSSPRTHIVVVVVFVISLAHAQRGGE